MSHITSFFLLPKEMAHMVAPNFLEVEKYNSTMSLGKGRGKFGESQ